MVIVLLFAAGVWVQRAAYRQLRGTKATYGRIVDFVSRNSSAGTHIVTDVWWLDQLAASAVDGRTLLFAGEPETGSAIVRRLDQARVPVVTVFRTRDQSAEIDGWSAGTCYVEDDRQELSTRKLVAIRLRWRCR
jgi:hypothetical protein